MNSGASQRAFAVQLILVARLIFVDCIKLPCHYYDSINITNGVSQQNKSIFYDNTDFPYDQYAKVNYTLDGIRKDTEPYIRGCLCNVKPCYRLCCSNKIYESGSADLDDECNEALNHLEGDVLNESSTYINLVLDHQFIYFKNRTCKQFFIAELNQTKTFEKVPNPNKTSNFFGYCPININTEINHTDLEISMCLKPVEKPTKDYSIFKDIHLHFIEHVCMTFSMPFLIVSFIIYISIPKLRENLHGKCFICYLFFQECSFLLELLDYNEIADVNPIAVYLFLCAFQWLNVTAFDAWCNLGSFRSVQNTSKFSERKRFILYMLYALVSPFMLWVFKGFSDILKSLDVGEEEADDLTIAGFIGTTFTFNVLCFILTALKIRKVQNEIKKVTSQDDSYRHLDNLNTEKGNFRLYLRLFIMTGMTHSVSELSYLISRDSTFSEIFELLLSLQGVWIFILFVLKRRVFILIKQRWQCINSDNKSKTPKSEKTNETELMMREIPSNGNFQR